MQPAQIWTVPSEHTTTPSHTVVTTKSWSSGHQQLRLRQIRSVAPAPPGTRQRVQRCTSKYVQRHPVTRIAASFSHSHLLYSHEASRVRTPFIKDFSTRKWNIRSVHCHFKVYNLWHERPCFTPSASFRVEGRTGRITNHLVVILCHTCYIMLHHYLVPLGYWMLQVTRHWFESSWPRGEFHRASLFDSWDFVCLTYLTCASQSFFMFFLSVNHTHQLCNQL